MGGQSSTCRWKYKFQITSLVQPGESPNSLLKNAKSPHTITFSKMQPPSSFRCSINHLYFQPKQRIYCLLLPQFCRATWIVVKERHLVLWICLWAKDMCLLTDPWLSPCHDKTQNTTLIQWLHKQCLINIWLQINIFFILSDFIIGIHLGLRLCFFPSETF